MAKSRKKKPASPANSEKSEASLCPACGVGKLKDGVCSNCNFGRKRKPK